jgi:phthalate 4,5-dioxygenase oxygenase subunit
MNPDDNERMCRVGPGTPMGEALRRRWVAACLTTDVPEPDGAPLRIKLLDEWFVVFRDSNGTVGVLDEHCPHRGASLAFARNENCGLRCLWHGWKIGVDGALHETPNIADDHFRQRVTAPSYDAVEHGGFVWVNLAGGERPPLPDYQWAHVPEDHRLIVPVDLDSNYTQPLEGLADSSHVGILHSNLVSTLTGTTRDLSAIGRDQAPNLVVEPTDFGFHYAALRTVDEPSGGHHVRVTAYAAPLLFFIAPAGQAFMSVPQDDTHSRFYNIFWSSEERLVDGPAHQQRLDIFGLHPEQLDEYGMTPQHPLVGDLGRRNRFAQNRAAMSAGSSFTGLNGLTAEDAAMTASMGDLCDRQHEHLVPADLAVIRLRRILRSIAEEDPDATRTSGTPIELITAVEAVIGPDDDWHELVPQHRVAGGAIADSDLETARAH